jgi:hypothetical protein
LTSGLISERFGRWALAARAAAFRARRWAAASFPLEDGRGGRGREADEEGRDDDDDNDDDEEGREEERSLSSLVRRGSSPKMVLSQASGWGTPTWGRGANGWLGPGKIAEWSCPVPVGVKRGPWGSPNLLVGSEKPESSTPSVAKGSKEKRRSSPPMGLEETSSTPSGSCGADELGSNPEEREVRGGIYPAPMLMSPLR